MKWNNTIENCLFGVILSPFVVLLLWILLSRPIKCIHYRMCGETTLTNGRVIAAYPFRGTFYYATETDTVYCSYTDNPGVDLWYVNMSTLDHATGIKCNMAEEERLQRTFIW